MKKNNREHTKKNLELSLPEESWQQLSAMANGQQKQLESIIEDALTAYLRQQEQGSGDDKIDPIEDTEPAKSWGYNSDVRGK